MYLSDFARFWRSEMNSLQCPPYPKKITELPLSARMLLENFEGGKLCQDMFGNPSALPADTLFRFQNEQFVPDDIEHYERAGLTVAAETARNRAAAAGDQQLQIRAEQGRAGQGRAGQKRISKTKKRDASLARFATRSPTEATFW